MLGTPAIKEGVSLLIIKSSYFRTILELTERLTSNNKGLLDFVLIKIW